MYTVTDPDGAAANSVNVTDANGTLVQVTATIAIGRLQINTLGGNDQVDVNNTTGLITLPGGIGYEGGVGSDLLRLIGATVVTSSTYNVGPQVDAGWVRHVAGLNTQDVYFTGLEPVIDLVAGPLTVNATDANNAIDYRLGTNSGTALILPALISGQVS
ncbi:MAG: hypothetical protein HYV60_13090, partial [Planctomycetia bacterium]|nr:hypothetical protein [Planctomycetia bacterium]